MFLNISLGVWFCVRSNGLLRFIYFVFWVIRIVGVMVNDVFSMYLIII